MLDIFQSAASALRSLAVLLRLARPKAGPKVEPVKPPSK